MPYPCPLADSLPAEHRALCLEYAAVQERCSKLIAQQRADIARLQAQVLQLRAAAIVQVSALAFAREDHAALQRSIPGLPRRVVLARHVDALVQRVHRLMGERLRGQVGAVRQPASALAQAAPHAATSETVLLPGKLALLEASMAAADLVICQTGCLSHGAYWRDNEHCRRTGKACTQPDAPATTQMVVKTGSSPCQSSAESYQNK